MTEITKEEIEKSLLPKIDHLTYNHVKLGSIIVCVARVAKGPDKKERPVRIDFEPHPRCLDPDGKPLHYLPCKGMRIILSEAWGVDGAIDWIGKSMELFGNPEVMYGGKKTGGVQIANLSNITAPLEVMLTVSRGRKEAFRVGVLKTPKTETPVKPAIPREEWLRNWLAKRELPEADAVAAIGGRTLEEATDEDWAALKVWMKQFAAKQGVVPA